MTEGAFGLYVHWPFCAAKCPYCDFNSHVTSQVDHARWREALLTDLRRVAPEFAGRPLRSVFFGGGTPSLMMPHTVGALLDEAVGLFDLAPDWEVTLEANPGSVETQRMADFRAAGVNRVSIGVQALNDPDLRRLGRIHNAAEAVTAIDTAASLFTRFSFDLIYARQDQTVTDWQAELQQAISMAGDHLSLYQLTIEEGTVFAARHAAGKLHGLPDEDRSVEMFQLTDDICSDAGFVRYEVSNHARNSGASRHNLIYWEGGDYAGIGPGAHGRHPGPGFTRLATTGHRAPAVWLQAVTDLGSGEAERVALSLSESREERLLMGLRLAAGIPLTRLGLSSPSPAMRQLEAAGLIWLRDGDVGTTDGGVLLLNHIIYEIAADMAAMADGTP